ncbi:hypothetical protein C8Q77DRAFT_460285 [Trametes polyzona]|nr:hypothetical protein C8Q77DRAFT_460285 [Trametes polyzona]
MGATDGPSGRKLEPRLDQSNRRRLARFGIIRYADRQRRAPVQTFTALALVHWCCRLCSRAFTLGTSLHETTHISRWSAVSNLIFLLAGDRRQKLPALPSSRHSDVASRRPISESTDVSTPQRGVHVDTTQVVACGFRCGAVDGGVHLWRRLQHPRSQRCHPGAIIWTSAWSTNSVPAQADLFLYRRCISDRIVKLTIVWYAQPVITPLTPLQKCRIVGTQAEAHPGLPGARVGIFGLRDPWPT